MQWLEAIGCLEIIAYSTIKGLNYCFISKRENFRWGVVHKWRSQTVIFNAPSPPLSQNFHIKKIILHESVIQTSPPKLWTSFVNDPWKVFHFILYWEIGALGGKGWILRIFFYKILNSMKIPLNISKLFCWINFDKNLKYS